MARECRTCRETKDDSGFALRAGRVKRDTRCIACTAEYMREWHARQGAERMDDIKEARTRAQTRNRERLLAYLVDHPCVDCGHADPMGLDFDHVEGTKRVEVTTLASRGVAWRTVASEIALCVVRCANCHQRRTAGQFGYWKTRFVDLTLPPDRTGGPRQSSHGRAR